MKLNEIKINGYGKLKNKEYKFKDGINIIKGENESGKSTILSYIINMLYGPSRTKDGKDISDFEKYKPWVGEEYSGKLSYLLDNEESFEIFREFNKKNPKIFNSKMEEISSEYGTDKKEGSTFFVEQTKIDKAMFLSTIVSMQQEVRLSNSDQNALVQKIANIAGTGEDKISYKKAYEKLQKKIKDEVGTSRSSQKPLNIAQSRLEELDDEIEDVTKYENRKYEIDSEIDDLNEELELAKIKKEMLLKLKDTEDSSKNLTQQLEMINKNIEENNDILEEDDVKLKALEEKKIKINKEKQEIEETLKKYNEEMQKNEQSKSTKSKQNVESISKKSTIFAIISAIILITGLIINKLFVYIPGGILLLGAIIAIIIAKKKKDEKKDISYEKEVEKLNAKIEEKKAELENKNTNQNELIKEIAALEGQMSLLRENNNKLKSKAKEIQEQIDEKMIKAKDEIIEEYNEFELENIVDIKEELNSIENDMFDIKNSINRVETEERYIFPQLDNLVNLREEKYACEEKIKELKENEETINIAIKTLEEAYEEMKTSITPKFTKNLSENISKISNGKYSNVTINDEKGIVVETENGDYMNIDRLSVGTIDALYFALRLSMIDDLSEEQMPILLDETFAYFDNNRLEEALKYLIENKKNHQVILFTCSNRETDILDNLEEGYNLIEL